MAVATTTTRREWWKSFIDLANRLMLSYWIIRVFGWLTWVLPLKISYTLSEIVAFVIYWSFGAMRDVWTRNIRQVMGISQDDVVLRKTVRQAYRNYFRYLVNWLRLPRISVQQLEEGLAASGWEHIDAALARGKGVIFTGFHLGDWELAAPLIAARGYPLNVVVDSFKPERMNELIQQARIQKGITIIPLDHAAPKLLRALRKNEVLALLIDRPSGNEGVRVMFCGAEVSVPGGPAQLSLRTGASLLTGAIVRQPDGTMLGIIEPPVEIETNHGDPAHAVQSLTQKTMERMENWVRKYPDQWYMFRPMWCSLPKDGPAPH
jgi:KDO2-lipid IV(A) lauroyltransferase